MSEAPQSYNMCNEADHSHGYEDAVSWQTEVKEYPRKWEAHECDAFNRQVVFFDVSRGLHDYCDRVVHGHTNNVDNDSL